VQSTTRAPAARAELLLPALLELKGWVRRVSHQLHSEYSTASLVALSLLERHGPVRVSELAEMARVDPSVVSRAATSLERAGLVERSSDPADGRAHRLQISPDGRAVLQAGRRELVDHVAERLTGWTDTELADLTSDLVRLLTDLGVEPALMPDRNG
jgi:DNA-binding MarR family transcriptional regulator